MPPVEQQAAEDVRGFFRGPRMPGSILRLNSGTSGAARTIAPTTAVTIAAARNRSSRATSSAIAGISGRMYCGRFDCEIEKKMNGTTIQSQR